MSLNKAISGFGCDHPNTKVTSYGARGGKTVKCLDCKLTWIEDTEEETEQ